MDKKIRVLFVCVHNSARSQMAEALLKFYGKEKFEVYSAGLEPGKLNPVVVDVMKDIGIDISGNKTKSVKDFLDRQFDYVITVCDETSGQSCPVFPGNVKRLHWSFSDPSSFIGSYKEKKVMTKKVCDEIEEKIKNWVNEFR